MLLDPDLHSQYRYRSGSRTIKLMRIHADPDPQHFQHKCIDELLNAVSKYNEKNLVIPDKKLTKYQGMDFYI
jgi:hypothetical protein